MTTLFLNCVNNCSYRKSSIKRVRWWGRGYLFSSSPTFVLWIVYSLGLPSLFKTTGSYASVLRTYTQFRFYDRNQLKGALSQFKLNVVDFILWSLQYKPAFIRIPERQQITIVWYVRMFHVFNNFHLFKWLKMTLKWL